MTLLHGKRTYLIEKMISLGYFIHDNGVGQTHTLLILNVFNSVNEFLVSIIHFLGPVIDTDRLRYENY